MLEQLPTFGQELRRRRLEAHLSLAELGRLVHYSKGQLSKVERGLKPPGQALARLCDTQLAADGRLAAMVPEQAPTSGPPDSSHDGEVWLMHLGKDGSGSFQPVGRRQVITAGAASALSLGLAGGVSVSFDTGAASLIDAHRSMFHQFRRLGQASGPGAVLPSLIAQTHSLEQLAGGSGAVNRQALLVLAARYAEYTGWMAQESGNDEAALWWTDRATEYATAGHDHGLAVYALVRRALISLFRGDVSHAVQLAGRALDSDAPPRVRGLAAQHLAQSHAVGGDYNACMRALDRARDLLALDSEDPTTPVIGASQLPDVVSMFTGWCLYELGRPQRAAEALDRETAGISSHALRTRARYGVRRALAHAAAGDIDRACEVADELLHSIGIVHSATIATDLRRLARDLGRHPRNASVRALGPALAGALGSTTR
ncbi:helix-turn-helix transcriptional regulator [Streptomyces sp. NPDC051162]|uniref:helix-turn-helix transcriptional regulator n=1 Tax=Streptomyces sp. NPDC051162 TaxID=3154747 RepID=UPI0034263813